MKNYLESLKYYQPELVKSLGETAQMLGIAAVLGLAFGLLVGIGIFLTGKKGAYKRPVISFLLNSYVNITRSFPFLLLVVAMIPLTRKILGTAFGPVAASLPLSVVAVGIYGRLVEQSLLEVPKEVFSLADSLGATVFSYVVHFLLVEARSSLVLSFTSTLISLVSYSTVMGIVGGGGIGDFAIRYGYQRYEYGIMYTAIILMILFVFLLQVIGSQMALKIDQRK